MIVDGEVAAGAAVVVPASPENSTVQPAMNKRLMILAFIKGAA